MQKNDSNRRKLVGLLNMKEKEESTGLSLQPGKARTQTTAVWINNAGGIMVQAHMAHSKPGSHASNTFLPLEAFTWLSPFPNLGGQGSGRLLAACRPKMLKACDGKAARRCLLARPFGESDLMATI